MLILPSNKKDTVSGDGGSSGWSSRQTIASAGWVKVKYIFGDFTRR